MKAFVTGATGFVGSHLVDRLLKEGVEVYCLKRKTSNTRWLEGKNVYYVNGDLYSNDVLEKTIKDMDYVFHVAGVLKSKNKEGYEKGNNLATKNLIEITHKVKPDLKKFVHISSLAVCGPTPGEKAIDENYIPKPITNYGTTKYKAEQEVLKYRDRLPVTIIRPPAVFGPRDTEILVYFQTFSKGLNSVIGFKEKYLSLIYIEDLIDGIMLAAEKPNHSGEIYFISSDKAYNWNDIGNITSKLLGKKAIKIKIPHSVVFGVGYIAQFFSTFSKNAATLNVEKCKDITRERWVCSNQKAKDELGFIEKHTLEESFAKTIDWYKKNNWIKN
ncbi:MAG: NAD-dependent epimerase/dehydratase family protein [Ignavibacteria bacterium]|nr:NAD-dependent epimerase/dehydratase family protein [Ignavibacteria bacterium]